MNYIDWHQSKDERPVASDGSKAWLAALEALPRDELTRMANAIEAELEHQRNGGSPSRFVIEEAGSAGHQFSSRGQLTSGNQFSSASQFSEPRAPAWLLRARDRRPTSSSEILNDTGYVTDDVPPSPPPSFLPPALMRRPTPFPRTPIRSEASGRRVYFAFDFDDLARVELIRQSGKVGLRETIQRGFYDRAVWESRALKNESGLLALMREAVRNSTTVCVLSGPNTWRSRWVKYEIARAVIDERGLLAIHIDDIEPNRTTAAERPGLNPLHVMGIYQHENGHYYLVERHEVVKDVSTGALGFEWRLYADHPDPLVPPRYVGDIDMGRAAPLSMFTAEHDFLADDGAANIVTWIDDAAAQVGR